MALSVGFSQVSHRPLTSGDTQQHGVKYIWEAFHLSPSGMGVTLVWGNKDPEKYPSEDTDLDLGLSLLKM